MAKKQGYKDEEDESIGMRLGKKKTKHDKKVARDESYGKWGKRSKDWKAKSGTMVTAKGGTMIKAKHGKSLKNIREIYKTARENKKGDRLTMRDLETARKVIKSRELMKVDPGATLAAKGKMIKAKKGWGKKLAKAAVAAGAAYAGSKYLKAKGMKGSTLKTGMSHEDINIKPKKFIEDIPGDYKNHPHLKSKKNLFIHTGLGAKKGGSIKAKTGKMVKARGGVMVNTKLNGPLFTQTF